jgi:hypothetical protein
MDCCDIWNNEMHKGLIFLISPLVYVLFNKYINYLTTILNILFLI